MNSFISVLVCDDSALMRKLIREIIETDSRLNVVATAFNGMFALKKIPVVKPDIIILDIEMPEMNGIEFLKARKEQGIEIPVIILSSIARKGAQVTMQALELGASDFILKPSGSISRDIDKVGDQLRRLIHIYGGKKKGPDKRDYRLDKIPLPTAFLSASHRVGSALNSTERKAAISLKSMELNPTEYMMRNHLPEPIAQPPAHGVIELVVIGISTGGPNALRQMLPRIPKDFPVPIVIVQHMPEGFTGEFANSLNGLCYLDVKEVQPGDILMPGKVFIAPGNYHIEVDKMRLASVIEVTQKEPVNGHRPSVDVLFASVAKHYGNKALAVIMTGMGRDGAREMGTLFNMGSWTLGQAETSCIVYGMPRVAIESGYVETIVELDHIADEIIKKVTKSRK